MEQNDTIMGCVPKHQSKIKRLNIQSKRRGNKGKIMKRVYKLLAYVMKYVLRRKGYALGFVSSQSRLKGSNINEVRDIDVGDIVYAIVYKLTDTIIVSQELVSPDS